MSFMRKGQCSLSDFLDAIKYQTGLQVKYMFHDFLSMLILWQIYLMRVDLMAIDFVRIDVMTLSQSKSVWHKHSHKGTCDLYMFFIVSFLCA